MKFTYAICNLGLGLGCIPALVAGRLSDPASEENERELQLFGTPTILKPAIAPITRPTIDSITGIIPTTPSPSICDLSCRVDDDCPRICTGASYRNPGTCVSEPPSPAPVPTTPSPTMCECSQPSTIPDKCEVEILIDMMEPFVMGQHELLAQWTRAAFHDAGTFDQTGPEGGANGCLLNHPAMRLEPENAFLDAPLNTLEAIKIAWIGSPFTCIDISSADIIQFAAFFATVRQRGFPESLLSGTPTALAKRDILVSQFEWGRPDELNCDTGWTDNLPGFTTPASGGLIPARCTAAGGEIKDKMMDRNGFTALEATALIGAHTIGLVRNTFGPGLAGPWVANGEDNATPDGPVFDNAYHDFLINTIVENTAPAFAGNVSPFTTIFPDWFRDDPNDLDHLDTDVALAFPTLNAAVHPDFRVHSSTFAASNGNFFRAFFPALKKMSKLGVTVPLSPAGRCESPCEGAVGGLTLDLTLSLVRALGNATAFADKATMDTQENRADEIKKLTTPIKIFDPPNDDKDPPKL